MNRPVFARIYNVVSRAASKRGEDEYRNRLVAGLEGRVIEIGAGNGLNFRYYPASVTEVVAVEPEPHMRAMAEESAKKARVTVRIVEGVAENLPEESESFDAAVVSLVLCSVKDPARSLSEAFRVVRPGGRLRFYEHVAAESGPLVVVQKVADATFWPRVAGGCHLTRDTTSAIEKAGFQISEIDRFGFSGSRWLPAIPHILGEALRR